MKERESNTHWRTAHPIGDVPFGARLGPPWDCYWPHERCKKVHNLSALSGISCEGDNIRITVVLCWHNSQELHLKLEAMEDGQL